MVLGEEQNWVATARSLLFVPANRPDRFAKARNSGADGIILDLEDGVPEADKSVARANALSWLESDDRAAVRINGSGTPWQQKELEQLGGLGPVVVMVPKVENVRDVQVVAQALAAGSVIVATIETARGLINLAEICAATGVIRVGFGNADLATDLGVSASDRAALQSPRSAVVVQSRAHELAAPLDGVTLDVKNEAAVREDSAYAASMGFGGRICIHPAQVSATNDAFQPSVNELEWARRIMESEPGVAVQVVNGQMIDKPLVERARRILARSR